MNSVLRARVSVAVLVGAVVATAVVAAATSIGGPALGSVCTAVVTMSGLVALQGMFDATRTTGRAPFYWGLTGAAALMAGFAYVASTADEPSAIPLAGLVLVLFGLGALVVSVGTLPAATGRADGAAG